MTQKRAKAFGKYVPITKGGQVRFYLPLERCAETDSLSASGYEVAEECQDLITTVKLIREAESRRAVSDQRKRAFIAAAFADFSREVGSVELLCPYCLGQIEQNCPAYGGKVICGWYDELSNCNGSASYTIDRANFVLGMPDVERYSCPAHGTVLQLTVYDLHFLREEIDHRIRIIREAQASTCDIELARIFPLRVSLERTRRSFRELVWEFMQKDAISWLNTLSLEDLTSLLERATTSGQQRS